MNSSQMYAALNEASAAAVLFALGGRVVGRIGGIGTVGVSLQWLLRGLSLSFGAVWFF